MFDLGPHASFIVAAYGVTVIAVGALLFTTVEDDRRQRRKLAELERQGIRRRSAGKPKPAAPTVKIASAKPKAPRTATKRKPAKARARKTSS